MKSNSLLSLIPSDYRLKLYEPQVLVRTWTPAVRSHLVHNEVVTLTILRPLSVGEDHLINLYRLKCPPGEDGFFGGPKMVMMIAPLKFQANELPG